MPVSRTRQRFDPRRALAIYISDRNRLRPVEMEASSAEARDPANVDSSVGMPTDRGPAASGEGCRIAVPETLDYGRNAGTWRERLPT